MFQIDDELSRIIRGIRLIVFDFDGVFTDNMVYVFQDGTEAVRCTRSDGIGLEKLRSLGIDTVILSTETNPVVSARAEKLRTRCLQSCADKGQALEAIASENGLSMEQIAFVGNDINDLPCLTTVGLPIVVQDAHDDVLEIARYTTTKAGGRGAVREVCDLFENVLSAGLHVGR